MPKVKCTISEVIPKRKSKQNPILAHFQNGELSSEFASSLDACIGIDTANERNDSLLIAISKNNVYEGYIDKGYPTNLRKTLIGIRKRDSNEIKLVEVSECSLLSYHYNLTKVNATQANAPTNMSSEGAKRIMLKDFGGKKALRFLDRKEKMKVNVDVVKDALEKTLMEFSTSLANGEDEFDKAKIQQDQILQEMVPPINKEATKLTEVYSISKIIEPEILNNLNEEAINLLKRPINEVSLKVKYLKSVIEQIQRSKVPDDKNNLEKVKACIFIDALVAYFKQVNTVRQNQTVHINNLTDVTNKLNHYIKKKFTQPNALKTTKTNYVVHKVTCYIIVLSLLVSDRYELDIQHIVEEIGIAKTNILKMINNIAVRPKSKTNILSIRLPSQLRTISSSFRKRRTL